MKKEYEDLHPLVEFMDGKEVITITTSNTVSTSDTLTTSMQGFKSGYCIPTYVGKSGTAFRSVNHRKDLDPIKSKSDNDIVPTFLGNNISHLLTPETFASIPPSSSNGASFTGIENGSELFLLSSKCVHEEEEEETINIGLNDMEQGSQTTTCSQIVQMNRSGSKHKDDLTESEILLTPDRFTPAYHNAEIEYENRICSLTSLSGLHCNSGLEVDLMTSDYEDELEQALKDLEQMEEDDRKEEERQTQHQSTSAYDNGRLPPIGVFWDIENCQVRISNYGILVVIEGVLIDKCFYIFIFVFQVEYWLTSFTCGYTTIGENGQLFLFLKFFFFSNIDAASPLGSLPHILLYSPNTSLFFIVSHYFHHFLCFYTSLLLSPFGYFIEASLFICI